MSFETVLNTYIILIMLYTLYQFVLLCRIISRV
jgi:hypothetical protein